MRPFKTPRLLAVNCNDELIFKSLVELLKTSRSLSCYENDMVS